VFLYFQTPNEPSDMSQALYGLHPATNAIRLDV
jgi:hypothetical protein